ncbi:MAG: L-threonylcarbamoyladenylate synthase [Paludibacteraceae bacterium]|jgi:tRNA threonylcarbamoyl adenosine modification protein (Sua5/YciO/YrdC/YwlC family)|nr:L-threonylcarbamoyladenylate synthase [Paludibacteraceae bacterium]
MLIRIYEENPNQREVDKVVQFLRDGGLIVYPTDTIYGLGCDIFNAKAVEKICRYKKIDPRKANLSFICYDLSNISEYAKVDNQTFKLMKKNLPGAFTFILNGNSNLPKLFRNKKTVGIRVPDNNVIRELVKGLGNPILSTSVKDDDDDILEYFTDPELIHERLSNIADVVIDSGFGELEPSTIVDCTGDEPVIVRQGKGILEF